MGFMFPQQANYLKGFGKDFKQQVRTLQPGFIHIGPWCKVLARLRTMCPLIGLAWTPMEFPFRLSTSGSARMSGPWFEMVWRMRERFCSYQRPSPSLTAEQNRMAWVVMKQGPPASNDPRTSVLNAFCQSHDVKNSICRIGELFYDYSGEEPHAHHHGSRGADSALHCERNEERGDLRTAS